MFCTACAAPNPPDAQSCAICGTGVRPPAPVGPDAHQPSGAVIRQRRTRESRSRLLRAMGQRSRPGRRARLLATLCLVPLLGLAVIGAGYYWGEQGDRAAAYARAEALLAAGRYPQALAAFGAAGGYRDADARRAATAAALVPYRTAYLDGLAALQEGRHDEAIALLRPIARQLPSYEDVTARLGEARAAREEAILRRADTAASFVDWLEVERDLAALAAENPDDLGLAARLADVRRTHAPLVFTRDEQLYLASPDMAQESVLTDRVPAAFPTWSPDRSRIAFVSRSVVTYSGDLSLYVIEANGTGLRKLAEGLIPYRPPVWSPDGTRIAYTSRNPFDAEAGPNARTVRVVDIGTGRETDLTGGKIPDATSPVWSPSGDRLAIVSRPDEPDDSLLRPAAVYVLTLATGAITQIGAGQIIDAWRLAWSPTDEQLLVYSRGTRMAYDADRTAVWLVDTRSGTVEDVNPWRARVAMPVWAPDGSRFAIPEGDETLRVRWRDGREVRIILPSPISAVLTWSHDGSRVIVPTLSGQDAYLVPLDTGQGPPTSIPLAYDTQSRLAGPPQWSAINPAVIPGPLSAGGTALDPVPPLSTVPQPEAVGTIP